MSNITATTTVMNAGGSVSVRSIEMARRDEGRWMQGWKEAGTEEYDKIQLEVT